jgi:hypothetical protein
MLCDPTAFLRRRNLTGFLSDYLDPVAAIIETSRGLKPEEAEWTARLEIIEIWNKAAESLNARNRRVGVLFEIACAPTAALLIEGLWTSRPLTATFGAVGTTVALMVWWFQGASALACRQQRDNYTEPGVERVYEAAYDMLLSKHSEVASFSKHILAPTHSMA